MTKEEAQIQHAIRQMYQENYSPYLVEKTLRDCHNEVKQDFKKMKLKVKHTTLIAIASLLFMAAVSHAVISRIWTTTTLFIVGIYAITVGAAWVYVFILEIIGFIKGLMRSWNKPYKF